ncbi:PD-(D/E)XK nuclease family protein [Stratiformator vulcanicus]|uniref:ATP-dependent helicase/deoxyribonuclease subunit B n=1 Tax=Stratiformator vulcanicus TaxID=2527980 RepID=A0A517R2C9_9PLAN|nr:PD-(D/E)XK nuclease family protein [Stratiformator vulcanicus]QDT38039.1 ATP-dependent helicase/deoxyribonuclease subunit B [Stratiformator vulcanicus]
MPSGSLLVLASESSFRSEVKVLTGPTYAGKTARLLEAYCRQLSRGFEAGRFGQAMWLTPTHRSKRFIEHRIAERLGTAVFKPQVVTFEDFCDSVVAAESPEMRRLDRVGRMRVLRDVIEELSRDGKLKHFQPIADTAGFLRLASALIAELKREEIWPEHFDDASSTSGGSARLRRIGELHLIYETYQNRLREPPGAMSAEQYYDSEGRLWSARNFLKEGRFGRLRALQLLIVDGFSDFTRTQREIVVALATNTRQTQIALTIDPPDRSRKIFAKTRATLEALRSEFGRTDGITSDIQSIEPVDSDVTPALSQVGGYLFDMPNRVQPVADATGVNIIRTLGPAAEARAVVTHIRSLISSGVAPVDIVVTARSLDASQNEIIKLCRDAGIGIDHDGGSSLRSKPKVRALLDVLRTEQADWRSADLAQLTNNSLLHFSIEPREREAAARDLSSRLRSLQLEGGRSDVLRAFSTASSTKIDDPDDGRSSGQPAERPATFLLRRLDSVLAPFRGKARFVEWVDRLFVLAGELGLRTSSDDAGDNGWASFEEVLGAARRVDSMMIATNVPIDLGRFLQRLGELIDESTVPERNDGTGNVRFLEADQIRAIDVPHLIYTGMTETELPRNQADDCLLNDGDRSRLADGGLAVNDRTRRQNDEMLLFHAVVSRARRSLTLTYSAVDSEGRPSYPSPYLASIRELFEDGALTEQEYEQFDPVPAEAAAVISERDRVLFAVAEALQGRCGVLQTWAAEPDNGPRIRNLMAAADMAWCRFHQRGPTRYDGWLSSESAQRVLAKLFPATHEFSVSELEAYANEPFLFFLSSVLRLEQLEPLGPRTDYRRRGTALHRALAKFHDRSLANDEERNREQLAEFIEQEMQRGPAASRALRALVRIESRHVPDWVESYLTQWTAYVDSIVELWSARPVVTHCEVAFGAMQHVTDEGQPAMPGVVVGSGEDVVHLRGQIDRVDAAAGYFNVIDYKLSGGKRFELEDVLSGKSLQLAVYARAVRELGLTDGSNCLSQVGYWDLSSGGFGPGMKTRARKLKSLDDDTVREIDAALDESIPQLASAIRSGVFLPRATTADMRYDRLFGIVERIGEWKAVAEPLAKSEVPSPGGPR